VTWVRRALTVLALAFGTATVAFGLQEVLPADPARLVAGPQARPSDVERVRRELALERPLVARWARYVARLVHVPSGPPEAHDACLPLGPVHVDLGRSYQHRRPVAAMLVERVPLSLALALTALSVQAGLGTAVGLFAAHSARQPRVRGIDRGLVAAAVALSAVPTYLSALLLQFVFAHRLRLFPIDGEGEGVLGRARALLLPALALGLYGVASYVRLVRDHALVLLASDHVRTARAKGASEPAVMVRHVLRNALAPLVTLLALDLGALVTGAVVVETVFRWPGVGALLVAAAFERDTPVVTGTVLVTAFVVIAANASADALRALLDPRDLGE
jgi:peptide/nickel transport system permease protein